MEPQAAQPQMPMPTAPPAAAAPPAPAAPSGPNVPEGAWPGASGIYKYSKNAVKLNLGTIIGLWVLSLVLQLVLQSTLGSIGRLLAFVVGVTVDVAIFTTYIKSVRGQKLSLGESLSAVKPAMVVKLLLLTILIGIVIALSVIALIIPFFFVFPRVALATYYLVDKNMGVGEAFSASWNSTKGHVSKVWGIALLNLAMALLMFTIIGIPFAIYFLIMYSAANAVLYEYINRTSVPQAAAVPAIPVAPAPGETASAAPQAPALTPEAFATPMAAPTPVTNPMPPSPTPPAAPSAPAPAPVEPVNPPVQTPPAQPPSVPPTV